MDKPNYILKINEAVWVPKNENSNLGVIKVGIWIVIAFIILGSFIFKENLFFEISWSTRMLLISLGIGSLFLGGTKQVPSSLEIRFYDEYFVMYRDKCYYRKRLTRQEFDKFYYKDIKLCQYRTVTKKINFFGIVEGIRYDYKKDGTLPEKPTYHKTTDSIARFYTSMEPDVDFIREIEEHSPIKVITKNS